MKHQVRVLLVVLPGAATLGCSAGLGDCPTDGAPPICSYQTAYGKLYEVCPANAGAWRSVPCGREGDPPCPGSNTTCQHDGLCYCLGT